MSREPTQLMLVGINTNVILVNFTSVYKCFSKTLNELIKIDDHSCSIIFRLITNNDIGNDHFDAIEINNAVYEMFEPFMDNNTVADNIIDICHDLMTHSAEIMSPVNNKYSNCCLTPTSWIHNKHSVFLIMDSYGQTDEDYAE